jgi:hypothetical protein
MRLIATIVAVLLLAGCGGSKDSKAGPPTPAASTTPAPITVTGTYTVTLDGLDLKPGQACGELSALNNYPDIVAGAQVTVRSAKGEILAVGALADGKYKPNPEWENLYGFCVFPFTVTAVAGGQAIYSIQVANRPQSAVPLAKLAKPVSMGPA